MPRSEELVEEHIFPGQNKVLELEKDNISTQHTPGLSPSHGATTLTTTSRMVLALDCCHRPVPFPCSYDMDRLA